MLNRSLFEHALVAWRLLLCPAEDEEQTMVTHRAMEQHPERR